MSLLGWLSGLCGLVTGCFLVVRLEIVPLPVERMCGTKPHVCSDGRIVRPTGWRCEYQCARSPADSPPGLEIMWNAPLHSFTGIASEAVDLIVPLARRNKHLGLTGEWSVNYIQDLPEDDQSVLYNLKYFGEDLGRIHAARASDRASLFVSQCPPDTYAVDLHKHFGETYDYRVGRAMFESTLLPAAWVHELRHMDEIWVPSHWGAKQFAAAGVPLEKIHVVPEPTDASLFHPLVVEKDYSLLPGSTDESFIFLSVFKWSNRKGWDILLEAFLTEFKVSEKVMLFIRSGNNDELVKAGLEATLAKLGIREHPAVSFVPRVSAANYPKLFRTADAFVLPTHGEAWGRPLAEAMFMEMPTIATQWSGQLEFMNDDNSFLVPPSGLEPAYPDDPEMRAEKDLQWAKVDPADLAKAMRHVFKYRDQARETGRRARRHLVEKFSRRPVAEKVSARLGEILATIRERTNHDSDKVRYHSEGEL